METLADPCVQCGSTEFEEVNGILYCHNGHQQEGGQQTEWDDGDFGSIGKISRRKEVKEKQKISKVYRGSKGFQLFLKAWQYILWKQCYTLIHQFGLPAELWTLVRELWSLRLAKLAERLEDPADIDVDINVSSSAPDTSDSEPQPATDHDLKKFKTSKQVKDNPALSDTISLNYIGMLLLRHPTRLSAFYQYVRQEKLCYIRAIRQVPSEILNHLASEHYIALDTTVVPTQHDLQLAVYRNATMYGDAFGITLPPLNWKLLLIETMQKLALPLEVFPTVKCLASMLEFDFAYPKRHGTRRNATTYPEAQLMGLLIVATKLLYPFDSESVRRYPQSASEPAALELNWQTWLETKTKMDTQPRDEKLTPERAIEVTDIDVMQMSEEKLDQYMDWFQQTYTKDTESEQVRREILNMFPLQEILKSDPKDCDGSEKQNLELLRLKTTQASMTPRYAIFDRRESSDANSTVRPGQDYQQYRSLGEMPAAAVVFHDEAAKLACLSVEALLRACSRIERLLLLNQHERRRAEYFDLESLALE